MNGVTIYNNENTFNSELDALVNQIKRICMENKIPFVCSFAVANSDLKTTYKHNALSAGELNIMLTDNIHSNILLAMAGGKFVHPSNIDFSADEDYINTLPKENMEENEKMKKEISETNLKEISKEKGTAPANSIATDYEENEQGHAVIDGELDFL